METLVLNTRVLPVKFNDTIYNLKFPTVKQLKVFNHKRKDDGIDAVADLLVECGLPEKITDELETDHIKALIERLTSEGK